MLKQGQEIIVQIAKEPLGKKGARITSHIALPGRYLVYMPTLSHTGVSHKIASAEDRARLRAYAREMGVVFQITDDLLDVTSTAEKTGKAVGKDAGMGKATLVTLLGVDGARAEALSLIHI